jgi:hypothetical protein
VANGPLEDPGGEFRLLALEAALTAFDGVDLAEVRVKSQCATSSPRPRTCRTWLRNAQR